MKYLIPLLFVSNVALAQGLPQPQQPQIPSEQEVVNSYVKALEQQLAFKNQQSLFYESKIRDWMEYSKPLWVLPTPQAQAK